MSIKSKVISIRLEIPQYTALMNKAYQNDKAIGTFAKDVLLSVGDSKDKIIALEKEIKLLKAELKKKPKEVVKTKEVKVTDNTKVNTLQAKIKTLEGEKSKLLAEIRKKPKEVVKEVKVTDNKEVIRLTKELKALREKTDKIAKAYREKQGETKKLQERIKKGNEIMVKNNINQEGKQTLLKPKANYKI